MDLLIPSLISGIASISSASLAASAFDDSAGVAGGVVGARSRVLPQPRSDATGAWFQTTLEMLLGIATTRTRTGSRLTILNDEEDGLWNYSNLLL